MFLSIHLQGQHIDCSCILFFMSCKSSVNDKNDYFVSKERSSLKFIPSMFFSEDKTLVNGDISRDNFILPSKKWDHSSSRLCRMLSQLDPIGFVVVWLLQTMVRCDYREGWWGAAECLTHNLQQGTISTISSPVADCSRFIKVYFCQCWHANVIRSVNRV